MKLYLEKENISLYLSSYEKLMETLSDDSIDMTLTSPPYDDIREYKGNKNFDVEYISRELYRVTKPGGVVIWNISDQTVDGSETGTSFTHALEFMKAGWKLNDTMIYVKNNPLPSSGPRYNQAFEYLFCFVKGKPKTFNPITYKAKYTGLHNFKVLDKNENVKYRKSLQKEKRKASNVFFYTIGGGHTTKDKIAFSHPAIMHEQLAIDQVKTWSNEGDLVFDPFAGSGTTAKACYLLKRRFIGSEINEEYCEIFKKRLEDIMLDENLFSF